VGKRTQLLATASKKLPNIATDSAVACLTYGGISNSDYNIYRQSHSETSENQSAFGKVKVMSTVAPVLFWKQKRAGTHLILACRPHALRELSQQHKKVLVCCIGMYHHKKALSGIFFDGQ